MTRTGPLIGLVGDQGRSTTEGLVLFVEATAPQADADGG